MTSCLQSISPGFLNIQECKILIDLYFPFDISFSCRIKGIPLSRPSRVL